MNRASAVTACTHTNAFHYRTLCPNLTPASGWGAVVGGHGALPRQLPFRFRGTIPSPSARKWHQAARFAARQPLDFAFIPPRATANSRLKPEYATGYLAETMCSIRYEIGGATRYDENTSTWLHVSLHIISFWKRQRHTKARPQPGFI